MGEAVSTVPQLLVVAAFSRHESLLGEVRRLLEAEFGPVAMASPPYDFVQTAYYTSDMGSGLIKLFYVFERLVDPAILASIKLRTNELEAELAASGRFAELRPLNLDPGLLSLGKFILATTKDQAHRIYLRDGIFAEVTLRFQDGSYNPWPWTYADYQLPEVREFLRSARDYYKSRRDEWDR